MYETRMAWFGFNAARALLLTSAFSTAFAQNIDDSWTSEVASVEEIAAYYSDGDELENMVRRDVAYGIVLHGIREMVGQRRHNNQLTSRERVLLDSFEKTLDALDQEFEANYPRTSDRREDYNEMRLELRGSSSFHQEVINRFAPSLAGVMQSRIAEKQGYESKYRDRIAYDLLQLGFGLFLAFLFLSLLVASWRDKRTRSGVQVEASEDMTFITYKPGKHGPVTALAIYPLYINVVLFMAALSVGLAFMFVAAENSEWMKKLEQMPFPDFLNIIFYREFWIGLLAFILLAPWWLLVISNFRRRKKRKIAVTRDAIIVGRKTYMLDELRRFYSWGYGDGSAQPDDGGSDIIIAGGNAAARAAASGAMHGAAIRESAGLFKRKVGRVGNQVIGEFGEHKEVLAKRLPATRAEIVAEEIEKAIKRHRRI